MNISLSTPLTCDCFVDRFQAASLFSGTPSPGRDHVQWEHAAFTSEDAVWQVPKRPCCDQSRGSHHFNIPVPHWLVAKTVIRIRLHSDIDKKPVGINVCIMNLWLCIILNYFVQKYNCVFYFIFPWSRCADKSGAGALLMVITDIQLSLLRNPRGGRAKWRGLETSDECFCFKGSRSFQTSVKWLWRKKSPWFVS